MDTELFDYIQKQKPKHNRDITRGLACQQLEHVEQYIENIIRCAEVGFPPSLRYVGCHRVTPLEEFNIVTAKRSTKLMYEFSHSDIYLMQYNFEFDGQPMRPRYLFLPFVKEGGLITIMGSTFSISPVLADKAVSVGEDSIFIPLNRDKLTFKRLTQHFYMDDKRVTANVIWSNIHHAWKKPVGSLERRTNTANATLAHYQFCKYGLAGAFQMAAKATVIVGTAEEITTEYYPETEWYIFQTATRMKPIGVNNKFYTPPTIRLALRHRDYNSITEGLIGGFFYVADRFPEQLQPEFCDDPNLWRTLMGHVIHASNESVGRLLGKINIHMESLDGYIDGMVREWLREDGVVVSDLYQLFVHVIDTFVLRVTDSADSVASMYGKRLMVLRYVLIDIIKSIFNMMFALQVGHAKKPLTEKDADKIIHKFMKPLLIVKINHKHTEVTSVSSPSDCMSFKITANLVLQSDIGAGNAAAKSLKLDASKILHSSIAEVGQFNNLPKTDPTGRKRINPYLQLGHQWAVVPNPKNIELLASVEDTIRR